MKTLAVFREFILPREDGSLDARAILTRPCYEKWLKVRRIGIDQSVAAFQRSLVAHLVNRESRPPFNPAEEEAVLDLLRERPNTPWPANLEGGDVGVNLRPILGHHERKRPKITAEDWDEVIRILSD